MQPQSTAHMFGEIVFEKPAAEIKERMMAKADALKRKVEERRLRVAQLREQYSIDDAALVELMRAVRSAAREMLASNISYTSRANGSVEERTIGAGVVNNLLTEIDYIDTDMATVRRLETIARNVKDRRDPNIHTIPLDGDGELQPILLEIGIQLSYEELVFLGF